MENKKVDLRKISNDELQKIKTKAMNLRDKGVSNKVVAQKLNLDPTVLSRWYRKYVKNYRQPQENLKRGRKQGTHKKLTDYQEDMIIKRLQEYSSLLDKELVQKIIEEQYNMKVPITTVGDYLKKWGVNSSFIEKFENEFIEKVSIDDFQTIEDEIKKRKGIILWVNVMDYELTDNRRVQSISTRVAKNKLVFRIYEKRVKAYQFVEFISQIAILFSKHLYVFFSTKKGL